MLQLGSVHVDFPVVQAALSGYSDWAMRVVARRRGAPYSLCEVALDKLILQGGKRVERVRLKVTDEEHPVGGQLMGSEPTEFAAAARELVGAGFDVIDINFGCPVRKVLGRCRGGYLLSDPTTALEIVSRVREAVPPGIPVTVKMRRGLDDTPQSRDRFFTIFDGLWERGVSAVTVHGRTVAQKYIGASRWEFLRELKQYAPHRTILGSGDLFTAEDCVRMIRETGVDGVTAARGAIGNPWIFREARALVAGLPLPAPPTVHEQRDALREHFELALELYGLEPCGRQMRKFGIKYARLHPLNDEVHRAFVSVRTPEDWHAVLARYYHDDQPGVRREPLELETCET